MSTLYTTVVCYKHVLCWGNLPCADIAFLA